MPPKRKEPQRPRRRKAPTARVVEKVYQPLNRSHFEIWNSNAQITAAISGHFGGKSHVGAYWLLDQAYAHPGEDFIVCGPTYNNLQNSAIPKLRSLMALFGLPWEYDQYYKIGFRSQNKEYWLPGGGVIYFRSADRPGSMQGAHVRAFWMDEVVDTTYYVYETLRGRIAGLGGRGLITSTPYDRGWLYEHVYKRWQELGQPAYNDAARVFVAQWKSIENPFFPREQYEDFQRTMEPWRFKMLYEGQFERPMGLIYDCFKDVHWIKPFEIPDHWERQLGIDWGFRDPMACIWLAIDPESGITYAYDEYYTVGWMRYETRDREAKEGKMSTKQEMLMEIIGQCRENGTVPTSVYCDSSEPDMVNWARDRFEEELDVSAVYGVEKKKDSIKFGIDQNYMLVKGGRFLAFDHLLHFRDETERYSWALDKVTGEVMEPPEPADRHNHLLDAWRYATVGSPDEPTNSFGVGSLGGGPYPRGRAA